MSENFWENADRQAFKSPESLNPSGKKEDLVDNLIQRAIGSAGRVKDNRVYTGTILYATYLSEKEFRQNLWPDIVEYVFPSSKLKKSNKTNKIVNEYIVFVPELCGCLPRPAAADANKFFEALYNIKESGKSKNNSLESLSADLKNTKNAERYLKMIRRFPRVYDATDSDLMTDRLIAMPGSTAVAVKFPYEYDTSIGVVVQPRSQ